MRESMGVTKPYGEMKVKVPPFGGNFRVIPRQFIAEGATRANSVVLVTGVELERI